MRPRLALIVAMLLAPLVAPGMAHAQPDGAQPLDRLLPEIRRTVPGQFLDAEGFNRNGAPGYRLKWLTPEGRVIERDVDARTGRMMGPDRSGFGGREGLGGREAGPRGPAPRGNMFSRENEGGPGWGRAQPSRGFGAERFNRGAGPGEGNRERFGGQGEGRRFGGGRGRGRGQED